jgi:hypothetical protein
MFVVEANSSSIHSVRVVRERGEPYRHNRTVQMLLQPDLQTHSSGTRTKNPRV